MRKVVCKVLENGILENRVLADQHVEESDILLCKEENMALMGDKRYVVLVISEPGSTISSEARKLVASADFRKNTIAKAFLVENLAHRIIGNFYLTFNKPAIPTRLFSDRDKALEWLRLERSADPALLKQTDKRFQE